jgi:hypothetical protein
MIRLLGQQKPPKQMLYQLEPPASAIGVPPGSILAVEERLVHRQCPQRQPPLQPSFADLTRRHWQKEPLEDFLFRVEPPASAKWVFPSSIRAVEDRFEHRRRPQRQPPIQHSVAYLSRRHLQK